jgi:hypothetical protein
MVLQFRELATQLLRSKAMSDAVQETGQQQPQVKKPKIITMFNHKAGVGKTTLTSNRVMAQAYKTWQISIQNNIAQMLIQPLLQAGLAPSNANFHLGNIPHYRSLMPKAQSHNKAIFELGHPLVRGAQINTAQQAGQLFSAYAGNL